MIALKIHQKNISLEQYYVFSLCWFSSVPPRLIVAASLVTTSNRIFYPIQLLPSMKHRQMREMRQGQWAITTKMSPHGLFSSHAMQKMRAHYQLTRGGPGPRGLVKN